MKYRRIVLVVFIILVGASIIYGLMDHRKVTTSSYKAYQAYLKGEEFSYRLYLKEALQEFEQAVKLDPNFAMAHARAAMLYDAFNNSEAYKKSRDRAIDLLDKVKEKEKLIINLWFARVDKRQSDIDKYAAELTAKYPNSLEALEYRAGRYFAERNYSLAIEWIQKLIDKYPEHAPSYNILGYSYFNQGDYDKALANIDKYSSLAQDQANPHDSHGELLLYLGRYDEALVQFRMADSIKPGLSFVLSHIGMVYRAKGMYRDAIGAFMKAADLSLNKEIKFELKSDIAITYHLMQQEDRAVEVLRETTEEMPENLKAHAVLGGLFAGRGQMEDALIQLGMVKSITSRMMASQEYGMLEKGSIESAEHYLAAKIAMAKGEYMDAAGEFRWVINHQAIGPDLGYFIGFEADALLKAQRPDSAITVLTRALSFNPNSANCLLMLGEAYRQTGQKESQRGALIRYLAVMKDADEGLPDVRNALAQLQ
jgi:tetratricopeptide (TPR) repeat protein